MRRRSWRGGERGERARLARSLRAAGKPWTQVAETLRYRYRINALTAHRLAHDLTQAEVAERWNQLWPDDPKTNKNISYWENWPGKCSREPSLLVLSRLAEIYQCAVADLVAGLGDYTVYDDLTGEQPLFHLCPHGFCCRMSA